MSCCLLRHRHNFIISQHLSRVQYTVIIFQGTRNCRACDRTSRIAYRARSNAQDLRRRYIFRWRLTRCLQIPRAYAHMDVRTHARTYTPAMFTRPDYRMHRCYTFLQWAKSYRNGSKSYKRGYGGNAGNTILDVQQHAFYSEKKLTRAGLRV